MRRDWGAGRAAGGARRGRDVRDARVGIHDPGGPLGARGTRHRPQGRHLYLGFVIEAEGLRLYHSGDSLAYEGLAGWLGPDPFDVLFLPINGRDPARGVAGNMSAAEAVALAAAVRPRFVVPHHYDMFTFNTVPVDGVRGRGRRLPAGVGAAGAPLRRALGDPPVSVTLGIDIGTSGTKTIAIDERGTILASASAEYPCDHPRPGWSEQDPELWWDATTDTVAAVLAQGRFKPADVAGDRPQRPDARLGLPRRRRRGDPPRLALERPAHRRRVRRDRGAGRRPRGADPDGGQPRPDRLHRPQAALGPPARAASTGTASARCLLPKDYIRYRLTGTYATEVSDASGTLLLDVANRRWSRELLGKLELDPALLPPCYESPEVSAQGQRAGRVGDGPGGGDAGRRRRRRPAGRGGGQRDRPAGGGLGDDGDLGRRLRARRPSSASTR